MTRLAELGLTLADVHLGEIEAEADRKLADYFVRTDYVVEAVEGPGTLFLGRKGSGKSALFSQLPRLIDEARPGQGATILLTPDQYSWAALKQYAELGLMAEQAHTNAWKYSLALEIAAHLVETDCEWGDEAKRALAELRTFLASNYGTDRPLFSKSAASLIKGLKSLDLSAFGFGVGVAREGSEQAPVTPAVTKAILDRLDPVFREVSVVVALDRLDDSWDGSLDSSSLLVGLLKAARDLNNAFRGTPRINGLQVLVFLRSDIYDSLHFDDKDKQRDTERRLVWSPDDLRKMLSLRLPGGVTADDLFEPEDMRGSIAPFNYIVKRTFLRPREILQFVGLCLQYAGRDAVQISKDQIRKAEEQYSQWKVDDLKQEYRKVLPHFERLLECLRQGVHRYDTTDGLSQLIEQKEPEIVEELGSRRILEMLFESSVIGIRPRDTGSTRFRSEDPNLALPSTGAVYVHQGLYRGLGITEARN